MLSRIISAVLIVVASTAAAQEVRQPGTTFRDCPECPEMVVIPAGSFTMGSPASEPERFDDEGPQHRVTIPRAIAIGRFEVTRNQFAIFVRETGYGAGSSCSTYEGKESKKREGRGWRNPGFTQGGRHPVVCVNWDDAKAYVRWLSRKTGQEYRLPSESEWEYASRAGTTTTRYWGSRASHEYANYGKDKCCEGYASGRDRWINTSPAGSFPPNNFDLYDMLGNVWEWVEDCWNRNYSGAPSDGRAWKAGDCNRHVLRGGSLFNPPRYVRSALHGWLPSTDRIKDGGFRVARTLKAVPPSKSSPKEIARALPLEPMPTAPRLETAPKPQPDPQVPTVKHHTVASIQRGLTALGYQPGHPDGVVGPRTMAAVRAFQKDLGLTVTGELSDELAIVVALALAAKKKPSGAKSAAKQSTGSGFAISADGHILTNDHVVEGCRRVRVTPGVAAETVARNSQDDLALLLAAGAGRSFAKFRQGRGIRPGDTAVVVGYPLQGLLTSDPTVTTGTISALAGPKDDRRYLQMAVPVQQGNSGGPLLDLAGNVVGIVAGKLNALKIAQLTGDIPQNVNFAISAGTARAFLDAHGVPYETAPSNRTLSAADVAAIAREFTVLVECWK